MGASHCVRGLWLLAFHRRCHGGCEMLIQFDSETSGPAVTQYNQPGRSHMREGASRNPAIQLRAAPSIRHRSAVAPSRREENDGALILSRIRAALIDIAALASAILLIAATGIGFTVAIYLLLFVRF